MRIVAVQLTQTEAADAAVMRNILTLLAETDGEVSIALGNGQQPARLTSFPPAPQDAVAAPQSTAPAADTLTHDQKAAAAFGGAPAAPAPTPFPAASEGAGTTPPAPTPGPAAGTRDVDAAGWPWDARIHAEPPSKTEKGLWRASRKAGASALKPMVEAELRQLGFGVITPPPPPAPAPQPGLSLEQQAQLLREQVEMQAAQQQQAPAGFPPAPAPTPAPAPVAAPTGAPGRSFEALMMRVQKGNSMGLISHDWLKQSYLPMGINSLMTLMQATGANGTRDAVGELHQILDTYEIPDHVKS